LLASTIAIGVACGKDHGPPPLTTEQLIELHGGGAEYVDCAGAGARINERIQQDYRLVAIQGYGLDNRRCLLVWETP